ncbi:hypothetical protein N7456_008097 [Penicillium angulare]|uniref:Xylanolytic transcriptional activator regulatory domain-containing protein n=1 Tax=Penicillium angulare TaxID=116970 RepID=A0A9W9FC32_9EURO|nr:hypothetical protein N7456_008097 [Penicillium angulare]
MGVGTQQTSTEAPATQLGGGNHRQISIGDNPPPSELPLQTEQAERENTHISAEQPFDLLSPERVKRALQSFFDNIYPLPTFSFLHKASLLRWNQTGQADHCLLLSIIAITSRLPGRDAAELNLGTRCSALAQNIILKDQGRPNIIKAQSLLLTIRYHMWSGNTSEALILMATLARFAFALRLNYENPNLCSLAQESRRRLMWAVYVLDTFLAGGIPDFTLCPSSVLHTSLPNQETTFELDTSYVNVSLHGPDDCSEGGDIGLLGYYIRVIYLRDSVLRRTKEVALSPQQVQMIPTVTNDLSSQLDHFALSLPQSVALSEKNLHLRAYSKWLPRYIIMHLWFQQCYCDLYRCFFPNLRESFHQETLYQLDPQFILDCQAKCLQHARQIATVCSLVRGLDFDNLVLDIETAECVYQAGRILLHGSQITLEEMHPPEPSTVGLVNDCILFIEQLALMFPTAGPIAKDLNTILHHSRSISVSSNDDPNLPELQTRQRRRPSTLNGRQIISKHSSLNRSQLNDESISEDMPFLESRPTELQASAPVAAGEHFVSPEAPRGRSAQQLDDPNTAFTSRGLGVIPGLTMPGGIPDPRGQDLWDQTSAFEGAWDVAIFHPMYDQQDIWPALNFFPTHIDMDKS